LGVVVVILSLAVGLFRCLSCYIFWVSCLAGILPGRPDDPVREFN